MKQNSNYDFSCYFSLVASSSWPFPEVHVSVKSKLQHPSGQPPGHSNFWKISVKIPPSPGQKAVQITLLQIHFRRRWGFKLSPGSQP